MLSSANPFSHISIGIDNDVTVAERFYRKDSSQAKRPRFQQRLSPSVTPENHADDGQQGRKWKGILLAVRRLHYPFQRLDASSAGHTQKGENSDALPLSGFHG